MSACEKCWVDSHLRAFVTRRDQEDIYRELVKSRECTPEEQAGHDATECPVCKRVTRHQHTDECMNCGYEEVGQ